MGKIKLTKENIELLEEKTNLAYNILRLAISNPLLISSVECLYKHDIESYLSKITMKATKNIRHLHKGGKKASKIEKYILQVILMNRVSLDVDDDYKIQIEENPNDNMGGLKSYINAQDNDTGEAEVFRLIQEKAEKIRKIGRYDLILNSLDYIRKCYTP